MIDTGPFIATERAGHDARRTLYILSAAAGTSDLSISAIAYTELMYGVFSAESLARARTRLSHLRGIFSRVPVLAYDQDIAEFAAQLRAEQAGIGNKLPFADSLIAATAMHLSRPLLTQNLRDFQRVPGLTVISFRML